MTNLKHFRLTMSTFSVLLLIAGSTGAADWPTYRHDNARTGCSSESLTSPLTLQWVYESAHPPRPAWSGPAERPREGWRQRHRVIFDDAFQVAAAENVVYFGSSSDDKLYALDAATGRERWSFYTGGPIRLAPTLYKDRIFVGSDDGFVYCLNAKNAKLIWKLRPGPNEERLLGSGRMISRWPIRTGVLIDRGIAYFGAGIFPHENVYVCAVKADNGSVVWKNDGISEQGAYRSEFSPQGYLLAAAKQLFIPSGRALPLGFDRTTGQVVFRSSYGWRHQEAGGIVGGTYALLADNQIYTGTQNHLLALDQKTGRVGFGWFPGRRLAVVGDMAYMATGSELIAMDRVKYAEASRKRNALEYKIKGLRSGVRSARGAELIKRRQQLTAAEDELKQLHLENITPATRWRTPSPCDAELILCRNLVFAGGPGQVNAFDRDSGKPLWDAKVDGKARGLAVADGRLYVSTNKGKIYCFAAPTASFLRSKTLGARAKSNPSIPPVDNPYPKDKLTKVYQAAAEAIVTETGITKGYCLVLGAEKGRLAWELAKRTDLKIIAVEPNPEKAAAARQALSEAGLYGERVVIDQRELLNLPYSNYFANLIVSDRLLLTGTIPGDPSEIVRHLKPCGGVICLGIPANAPKKADDLSSRQLSRWLAQMQLGQCRISQTNGLWATVKRAPLPGAGKWTHQYAEPGNTACSDDQIVTGPLGLLWFGEPGPAPMVNRHDAAAAPLAVNGRLFIQGENVVMAYDSYNGAELWRRNIPGAMRTRLKKTECGNLAASEDSFFIAVGDKCLRLDAETGETRRTYNMPPAPAGAKYKWGYLAYVDGILYGSAMTQSGLSHSVFAVNVASGKTLWNHPGKNINNLTIAIGNGRLFFVDSSLTPAQRQLLLQQDKSHLKNLSAAETKKAEAAQKKMDARLAVALDVRTGDKLWKKPVDVTDCSKIGIGGGELTAMYRDGVVVLCGANANGHYWKQFLSGKFSKRRLVALSAKTGSVLWAKDANYRHRPVIVGNTVIAEPWAFDLKTGLERTRPHPLTGEQTAWKFLRPGHHCGAISACPQMLFMRSGYTSYYDLRDDSGIRHFAGHRLGCWINAIPADGLALMPEASAGCICLFPIICSVALEPRPDHQRWAIYSTGGRNTPVQHLALNLGAPGDRRDPAGKLWFAYPRPGLSGDRAAMGFSVKLQTEFLKERSYLRFSGEAAAVDGADNPWLFDSCARGLKRCTIPLLSEKDKPADYSVKLYFADFENTRTGKRIFDIKLQDQVVLDNFDIIRNSGGLGRAIVKQFQDIKVSRNLEIEFVPSVQEPSSTGTTPLLCGLEVLRQTEPKSAD